MGAEGNDRCCRTALGVLRSDSAVFATLFRLNITVILTSYSLELRATCFGWPRAKGKARMTVLT